MERFFFRWLSPAAAALLVGAVALVIVLGVWSGREAPSLGNSMSVSAESLRVFPNVAAGPQASTLSNPANAVADILLLGTVLPTAHQSSRAVFRVNGKAVVVAVGGEVATGVRLLDVASRWVSLSDGAGSRRLEMLGPMAFPQRAPPTPNPSVPAPAANAGGRVTLASGCTATAAQRASGLVLSAELLAGALQSASGIAGLVNASSGRLVVQNSAGIGALIGLRDGDVLQTAEGKPLASPADLTSLILTPVSRAQAVSVDITRAGAQHTLVLLPPGCRQ